MEMGVFLVLSRSWSTFLSVGMGIFWEGLSFVYAMRWLTAPSISLTLVSISFARYWRMSSERGVFCCFILALRMASRSFAS